MLSATRYRAIVDMLQTRGPRGATVRELAQTLQVSQSTIRRDLDALGPSCSIVRPRGGVLWRPFLRNGVQIGEATKHVPNLERLARAATASIRSGQRVGIASGPRAVHVAAALAGITGITVVTPSLAAADLLHRHRQNDQVLVLGGFPTSSGAMGGPLTLAQARALNLDHLFVVAEAVDTTLGVTTGDLLDAEVLTASARNSRCVTVVAEADVWGRTLLVRALPWEGVHHLVTDDEALGCVVRSSTLREIQVIPPEAEAGPSTVAPHADATGRVGLRG